jgi:hypothetical protein
MSDERNDGGPAFPVGSDLGPASNIVDGGYGGMSLRDWFAGMALQGMLACPESMGGINQFAECAYEYADAMLAEREKEKQP